MNSLVRNPEYHGFPGYEIEFAAAATAVSFVVWTLITLAARWVTGIPFRNLDGSPPAKPITPRFSFLSKLDTKALYALNWEIRSSIHSLTTPYIALYILFVAEPHLLEDMVATGSWPLTVLLASDVGYYCFDMAWMMVFFNGEFDVVFFVHHIVALATYGQVLFLGVFAGVGALTYAYHIPTVIGNILLYFTNTKTEQSWLHRILTLAILVIWIPCRFGVTAATGWIVYDNWDVVQLMPQSIVWAVTVGATFFMALFNTLAFVLYSKRLVRAFSSPPPSPAQASAAGVADTLSSLPPISPSAAATRRTRHIKRD